MSGTPMKRAIYTLLMSWLLVWTSVVSVTAQAAVATTQSAVTAQVEHYDRQQLLQAINEQGVKEQLQNMGVDADAVEQRIHTLTGEELAQLNAEAQNLPAGQSVLGLLVLIFVVFIITDMMCATDIFNFVKCINK